jgi:hypothetical protein
MISEFISFLSALATALFSLGHHSLKFASLVSVNYAKLSALSRSNHNIAAGGGLLFRAPRSRGDKHQGFVALVSEICPPPRDCSSTLNVINVTSNNEERKGNHNGEYKILTCKILSNKKR